MRKALSSVLYSSLNNILSSSDITSPTATSMLLSLRVSNYQMLSNLNPARRCQQFLTLIG